MPAASVAYPDLKSKYKTLFSETEGLQSLTCSLYTHIIACKKICMQISNKDPFQKEISTFIDESKKMHSIYI